MQMLVSALALAALALPPAAQDAPFGTEADIADAASLWQYLLGDGLAGEGAIHALPYAGTDPHGMMLETFYTRATIGGHDGALVVKRNYGPRASAPTR
jgi:hypothetical protein